MKTPPVALELADAVAYPSLAVIGEEEEEDWLPSRRPTAPVDFQEYMWMEYEEDFDREVMERLEEEALLQESDHVMSGQVDRLVWTLDPGEHVFSSSLNPYAKEFVPKSTRPL